MTRISELMRLAVQVSKASDDQDHQTGCVLYALDKRLVCAANKLPKGVKPQPDRLVRPDKYDWMCHAETQAVAMAARQGIALDGGVAIVTLGPCAQPCMGALITAGIRDIIINTETHYAGIKPHWRDSWRVSSIMAHEAGVKLWLYTAGVGPQQVAYIPSEVKKAA